MILQMVLDGKSRRLGTVGDHKMFQAGASYTFGNFTLGGQYQDSSQGKTDWDVWGLMGKATFGNNAVSVVYTDSTFEPDVGSDIDRGGWGLAAEHNFSKRTKVYAAYAAGDTETTGVPDVEDDVLSLGMIHSF